MHWFPCHGHICICGQLSVTSVLPDMVCVLRFVFSKWSTIHKMPYCWKFHQISCYGNFIERNSFRRVSGDSHSNQMAGFYVKCDTRLKWVKREMKKKKKKLDPDSLIVVRLRRNLLRTLYRRCFDIMFPQNEKMEITSMGFIVGVFLVDLVINIYSNKWFSAGICLLEVSNSNSRSRCKICSK